MPRNRIEGAPPVKDRPLCPLGCGRRLRPVSNFVLGDDKISGKLVFAGRYELAQGIACGLNCLARFGAAAYRAGFRPTTREVSS